MDVTIEQSTSKIAIRREDLGAKTGSQVPEGLSLATIV